MMILAYREEIKLIYFLRLRTARRPAAKASSVLGTPNSQPHKPEAQQTGPRCGWVASATLLSPPHAVAPSPSTALSILVSVCC
jgi:hypothetical protein